MLKRRIDVVTLGVEDIDRALDFYRKLGWGSGSIVGDEHLPTTAAPGGRAGLFELEGGLLLMFYGRDDFAKDAATSLPPPPGPFSFGHLVESKEAVEEVLAAAVEAGATATEVAHERPWGIYSGYFADPDGHLWEVIWNQAMADGGPET